MEYQFEFDISFAMPHSWQLLNSLANKITLVMQESRQPSNQSFCSFGYSIVCLIVFQLRFYLQLNTLISTLIAAPDIYTHEHILALADIHNWSIGLNLIDAWCVPITHSHVHSWQIAYCNSFLSGLLSCDSDWDVTNCWRDTEIIILYLNVGLYSNKLLDASKLFYIWLMFIGCMLKTTAGMFHYVTSHEIWIWKKYVMDLFFSNHVTVR